MALIARPEVHKSYIDMDKNEIRNFLLQSLGDDIADPADGLIFLRTDTNKIRARINSAWVDLATMDDVTAGGISTSIVDAKGDLIVGTADNAVTRQAVGSDGAFLVAASGQTTGVQWRTITSSDLPNDGVTFAKMQNITSDRLVGRDTAGSGDPEEISVTGGIEFTGSGSIQTSAFTGDVTKSAGGTSLTIADGAVTNAKAADMAANTLKGNNTGSTADPADLTVSEVKTLLDYDASEIAFTPGDDLESTDVQAAIEETVTTLTDLILSQVAGQKWKQPVQAATTTNVDLADEQTIDGVALVEGDRVLVKNQTDASDNGIYVVVDGGPWVRADDANTGDEITRATVLVTSGTANSGDTYTQVSTITTIGTDDQSWQKSGEGNAVYTSDGTTIELVGNSFRIASTAAGNGLTGGGGSALAVSTGNGLEVASDAVRIATSAAGDGLTGGGGSALAVGEGDGIVVSSTAVSIDTSVVARKVSGTLGDGVENEFIIEHNLGTRAVHFSIFSDSGDYDEVEVDVLHTDEDNLTVIFSGYVPDTDEFAWVVVG